MARGAEMPQKRFRVAICGGGIGGLTLALVLHKFSDNIEIDLYETAREFTEVGPGFSVWKRTWKIMQVLGLDQALGKMAVTPPVEEPKPGFVLRKGDQPEGISFHRMVTPYGSITLHRADLLKVLTAKLPADFRAHFSKRLISYEVDDSGAVKLHFADGTDACTDVLVGADGIKSATRAAMYRRLAEEVQESDAARAEHLRSFVQPTWTGTYAYRALIDPGRLLVLHSGHQATTTPLIYLGRNRHVVCYPISQGRLINLVPFTTEHGKEGEILDGPTVVDVTKEELAEKFSDWEPEVRALMECADRPSRWAIGHIRGLPQYIAGHVALLGDAAHAMTTHFGAGAGQSIEDAYILGRVLAHPSTTKSNLDIALQVYDAVRRAFASDVVERSWDTGLLYEFSMPPFNSPASAGVPESELYSAENLQQLAQDVYDRWSWQWRFDVEEDWLRAREMFEERVAEASRRARP